MRVRSGVVVASAITVCWLFGTGCTQAGSGGEPVVWPGTARLGDTVAMAINSNYIPAPLPGDVSERHDLSRDNVSLRILEGTGPSQTLLHTIEDDAIVAVFDGHAAPAAIRQQLEPGVFLTVVVFNLPSAFDVAPSSYPATNLKVRLYVDGANQGVTGKMTVLGTGGAPTDFFSGSEPVDLEPRPTLRLRTNNDDTWAAGFEPDAEIGGLEFILEYPTDKVSSPEVFPATEASRSLAFLGPEVAPGFVKVFVTDPRGFTLPYKIEVDGVGDGFLVEFAFTKLPDEEFQPEDFTIWDLKVTDRSGGLLTPVFASNTDTTAYFERIVRKNLAE